MVLCQPFRRVVSVLNKVKKAKPNPGIEGIKREEPDSALEGVKHSDWIGYDRRVPYDNPPHLGRALESYLR